MLIKFIIFLKLSLWTIYYYIDTKGEKIWKLDVGISIKDQEIQ